MTSSTSKMTGDFSAKPTTQAFFDGIAAFTGGLGPVNREAKAQVSFSVNRKFLWLWAYEKTSDGTLYINVTLDHRVDVPHFHEVSQVSTNQWNHHVVVKTEAAARSDWLADLIRAGYDFAGQ